MLGVIMSGLPSAWIVSKRWSSVSISSTLGRFELRINCLPSPGGRVGAAAPGMRLSMGVRSLVGGLYLYRATGGRGRYAAQRGFAQLRGQHVADAVHRLHDLIQRYQRFHAAQR